MPAQSSKTPSKTRPSLLLRTVSNIATFALTLGVIGGAGFAVFQGSSLLAERAEAAAPPPAAPALPVAIREIELKTGYSVERQFLGEVRAQQAATLSFELGGQITEILVDEGAIVTKGDVLARLDTALLQTDAARLDAVRLALSADLGAAERRLARQEELRDRGFSPEEALDQARAAVDSLRARIAETEASLNAVAVRLDKATLYAPYDGRVAVRSADTGTTVAGGTPVMRVLQTGTTEIRVGLPTWVEASVGSAWPVDVAGQTHVATLTAIRPDIDPATRTRTALLTLDGVDAPFGSIARVTVPRAIEAAGAWIPRTALREGAPGVWTVLAVDSDGRARPAIVEILHTEADRLFVRGGVEDGTQLITGGPHRIVPGQLVSAQSDE